MKKLLTTLLAIVAIQSAFSQEYRVQIPDSIKYLDGMLNAEFEWYAVRQNSTSYLASIYSQVTHKYNPEYVNPQGFRILLDSRLSNLAGKAAIRYRWTIYERRIILQMQPAHSQPRFEFIEIFSTTIVEQLLSLSREPVEIMERRAQEDRRTGDGRIGDRRPLKIKTPIPTAKGPMLKKEGIYKIKLELLDYPSGSVLDKVEREIEIKNFIIGIIGDSCASGEGNPDQEASTSTRIPGNPDLCEIVILRKGWDDIMNDDTFASPDCERNPSWLEPLAHRSRKSGYHSAATGLELSYKHTFVTVLSFATSGASIQSGLLAPQNTKFQSMGQLRELKETLGHKNPDFLLVSVGANQIGFGDFVTSLLEKELTEESQDYKNMQTVLNEARNDHFPQLMREIRSMFPIPTVNVIFTEYSLSLFSKNGGEGTCGLFAGSQYEVDKKELGIIRILGENLNSIIKESCNSNNFTFITGITEAFKDHGYCASERYYIQAAESCREQCNYAGTLHPNEGGHMAIATLLHNEIMKQIKANTKIKVDFDKYDYLK